MFDFGLSVSYGQNRYSQTTPNQGIQHPQIYSGVLLGINHVSESHLLLCGVRFRCSTGAKSATTILSA